jgi:Raf kinase inhibitor-like YbhB/YbcL family protein
MQIFSPAFKPGEKIPSKYSCEGMDASIPLVWKDIPEETKSLALIMDDPDAPVGVWVHWVVFNIPPTCTGFQENMARETRSADGTLQGQNSCGQVGYSGPCPPGGTHRYFFKLYALDCTLDVNAGARKDELLKSMAGHILQEAQMLGTYTRGN